MGQAPGSWLEVNDTCMSLDLTGGWLYALGDVNHHALLTHQGKCQARIAAAADRRPAPPDSPSTLPRGTRTPSPPTTTQCRRCSSATPGRDGRARRRPGRTRRTPYPRGRRPPRPDGGRAGLYADGYTGRDRMIVDEDHGYLLGVTFVGPGVEELIDSATIAVARQVPISRLWARRPLLPLHKRCLAPPTRGLRYLSPRHWPVTDGWSDDVGPEGGGEAPVSTPKPPCWLTRPWSSPPGPSWITTAPRCAGTTS